MSTDRTRLNQAMAAECGVTYRVMAYLALALLCVTKVGSVMPLTGSLCASTNQPEHRPALGKHLSGGYPAGYLALGYHRATVWLNPKVC